WRGDVISVSREAIADELSINLRAAAFGVLIRFEHNNSGTFAHHEAVAITIVGTRSAFRRIVERRGKSATSHKSRHPDPRDRRSRAARHHDLRVTEGHQSRGISDGMRATRTCGDDRMVGPFEAMRDRYIARCEINQAAWNEERRDAARPSFLQHDRRFGDAREPANARTDHYSRSDLIVIADWLPRRIIQRLACGAHCEDDEVVDFALLFRLHPLIRIEASVRAVTARNLASDLCRQVRDVEPFDALCPTLAIDEALPGRFDPASERRPHAEPCDDNASHLSRPCPLADIIPSRRQDAPRQSLIAAMAEVQKLAFCVFF